jgi:deoxycytidine triphosphate deaminase
MRLDTLDKLVAKGLDTTDFLRLWHKYSVDDADLKPSRDDASKESPLKINDGGEEPPVQAGQQPTAADVPPSNSSNDSSSQPRHGNHAPANSDARAAGHGVLSEVELRRRLELGRKPTQVSENVKQRLIVTPEVTLVISGASMDVRIGRGFITFRRSSTAAFDALSADQRPREMQEFVQKDWGGEFVLHPGELVLAATLEFMMLPGDLTAQVVTRSSYGRLGLLSATAVQVQPKFTGCLTLELVNLGQMPLTLTPGERVAQLVFTKVHPPVDTVDTKYSYPTGPQFSKVASDPDLDVLRQIHRNRVK